MKSIIVLGALFLFSEAAFAQKFGGLALTPPMGWNSWNKFGCNVDENLIRETADSLVASGMRNAGYQFVVIDDCWHGGRDSAGFIYPNLQRFPSGMKALADYIHSKGLKFGIYSCAGNKTCGGHPGSRGYEYQDALTYARWGVDYLKYDWCNTNGLNSIGAYTTMRDDLYSAGRPIVFSICEWGDTKPWEWAKDIGHLWRTTGDIANCFDCTVNHGTWSSWGVMKVVEMRKDIRMFSGPGHWNDPDMLEVGNGMSINEDRAHFSLWCMMAAPLIAGNDLRSMNKQTIDILANREVIAIDQDSLGIQGFKYDMRDSVEIWVKPLMADTWALCFLNRSISPKKFEYDWSTFIIADDLSKRTLNTNENVFTVRNVWTKKTLGNTKKKLALEIPSHDVIMIRLFK